jgi:alkylation response protein AidB-like acyl-CoA dehydrogenase
MDFQYTEEQQLLADSVARLAEQHYDFEARKRIIASETGHSAEAWRQLAELGLTALTLRPNTVVSMAARWRWSPPWRPRGSR